MNVLIIQEQPLLALLASNALVDAGHQVISSDLDEGRILQTCRDTDIDLAIVDVTGSDSLEGAAVLDLLADQCPQIPLMVLAEPWRQQDAHLHERALVVLRKPVPVTELADAIHVAGALIEQDAMKHSRDRSAAQHIR